MSAGCTPISGRPPPASPRISSRYPKNVGLTRTGRSSWMAWESARPRAAAPARLQPQPRGARSKTPAPCRCGVVALRARDHPAGSFPVQPQGRARDAHALLVQPGDSRHLTRVPREVGSFTEQGRRGRTFGSAPGQKVVDPSPPIDSGAADLAHVTHHFAAARSREHSDLSRGRRGVRAAGSHVLDWQGQHGAPAPGARKAFHPARLPVPGPAHRHHLEVPRHDRFSRSHRRGVGPDPIVHTNQQGWPRASILRPRLGLLHRCDEDARAEAGPGPGRFTAAIGERDATKKSRGPKSAYFPCAPLAIAGIPSHSGQSCGRCPTPACDRRTLRVFPLSNWTEADVWQYIERERLEIVPLYFAKRAQGRAARRCADHGR